MSKFTKLFAVIAVSSIAFVKSLFAEEAPTPPNTAWTVTGTSGTITITEVLPEGASEDDRPWIFTLTSAGMLKKTQQGTGKVLNFRTIPLPENYVIEYIYSIKSTEPFDASGIEELYWPDTITSISLRTYEECSSLRICDYPEGTKITTIGERAFYGCKALTRFRVSDELKSIGVNAFTDCSKIVFDGPMLPKALKTVSNTMFRLGIGATPLPDGLLVIGSSGDDITWSSGNAGNLNQYFYKFNITNLIFGVGVSEAGIKPPSGKTAIYNPYSASTSTGPSITNIVVQNPGVFAFGKIFGDKETAPATIRQYDVAGWVTGTLGKHADPYQTRIMAAKNIYWKEFKKARDANKSKYYTPWNELSSDVQQAYWDNFNDGNVGSGDAVPFGLTKGISSYSLTLEGEEPLDPLTVPDNVWIVFKEGSWPGAGLKIIVR